MLHCGLSTRFFSRDRRDGHPLVWFLAAEVPSSRSPAHVSGLYLPGRWLVPFVCPGTKSCACCACRASPPDQPVGLGLWFTGAWTRRGPVDQTCPCPRADGPKYPCQGGRGMFLLTSELLRDPFVVGTQPEARKGEWADRCPADRLSSLQQGGPGPSSESVLSSTQSSSCASPESHTGGLPSHTHQLCFVRAR